MPNLRKHIDECKKKGIDERTCVIVNYMKGIEHADPSETDVSELTEREKKILYAELDRVGMPRPRELR